ncbi:MAG: GntR family transcriptional regulator [Planctomycetaceae bacterium]|nr:GntR family transcriptional regulator [Planctomycetaceae bacterium]
MFSGGPDHETLQYTGFSTDASIPKHERVRQLISSQIASGQLEGGDALPSEHEVARTLQIARSTVRQAMSSLEKDGLVRRVHGRGTFVHEHARDRLRNGQDIFALIVPETGVGFYPELHRSFEEAAARVHNQVIVSNTENDVFRQGNSILQLIDMRIAGVAIVPTTTPATPSFHIRQLHNNGIPVVFCARRVDGVRAPLLSIPFENVGRIAGEAIVSAGHRRIAFIASTNSAAPAAYERGFRRAVHDGGLDPTSLRVFYGQIATPEVSAHECEFEQALEEMFRDPDPPTAIFASFDSIAELIYVLLSRRGIRVPDDVSLVGFGGSRREGALLRNLTSVVVDESRLGREAASLLHDMRHGTLAIDHDEVREMPLKLLPGQTLIRHERRHKESTARTWTTVPQPPAQAAEVYSNEVRGGSSLS